MPTRIDTPLMALWFGNFYRPAFDDRTFVDASMEAIQSLGFNCVELDTKAWEDVDARCRGGEASEYVQQQEYMMQAAQKRGLGCMFLALYLNGDNLYPHIRFSPPIYGESVTNRDGTDGRWYKYWSEKALDSQETHVRGLLSTYSGPLAEIRTKDQACLPLCSMWDPIVAPSFDPEGQERYLSWLAEQYPTIAAFNAAYGTHAESFVALEPENWWFEVAYPGRACYTREEAEQDAPAFRMWADNMRWRSEELTDYFRRMHRRLKAIDGRLLLVPNLSQWNHYLNVDTSRKSDIGLCELWDTANRGIDMRALSPFVDRTLYYTLPVTADSDPEPYVVSCQHAHMRSLNPGRGFFGGVFWGRFLYHDVYRFVTPEETIGSIVQSGAEGIMAYGWCGMDDGGVLHRMDEGFLDSLRHGNAWARNVIPRLGRRRKSRVAILYPTAMALLEPLTVEGAAERRADFLGMYKTCRDAGFDPEIVEIPDLIQGLCADILLLPADRCYHAMRNPAAEEALRTFVQNGGTIIHGPDADPIRLALDIRPETTLGTCFSYRGEGGLPSGHSFVAWPGEALAVWREDGKNSISRLAYGQGSVYSFGFPAGLSYVSRTAPHVPLSQGNNELYPVALMRMQPLREILWDMVARDVPMALKDVECTRFEHGWVIVNHRSVPVTVPMKGVWHGTQESMPGVLPGHSAVFLETEDVS